MPNKNMPEKLPRLLFPAAFEALDYDTPEIEEFENKRVSRAKRANEVMERLDDIAAKDYKDLLDAAKHLRKNPFSFADLQRVVFKADYDLRLQPEPIAGYPDALRYLGVDLFKELSESSPTKYERAPGELVVIAPVNPIEDSNDFTTSGKPVVYIASPYSVARAISNIANRADGKRVETPHHGYMLAYDTRAEQDTMSAKIPGREGQITTETFYPFASTNSRNTKRDLITGNLGDVVLYDSEQRIELLDGDDMAIPSAAAFRPSIRFGVNAEKELKERKHYSWIPIPFRQGDLDYSRNTMTPSDKIEKFLNPYINDFRDPAQYNTNVFKYFYKYSGRTDIIEASHPQLSIDIGGHKILGGKGNDILYGFDPLLYAGMSASEEDSVVWTVGRRSLTKLENWFKLDPLSLKFLDNKNTNINWDPILLSGGEGMDIFKIGDISRINLRNGRVNVSHSNGNTIYTILGDKDSISEVERNPRREESWGDTMAADTFELTARYGYKEEVVQKGINIDYSTEGGGGDDWSEIATNTNNAARTILATVPKLAKTFPALDTALTFADLTVGLVKSFQNNKPAVTNKFYREELKQKVIPPGDWTKAINITDWDPLDRFKIQVIPVEDPTEKVQGNDKPWSNVNFKISASDSDASRFPRQNGHTLSMETSVEGPKPLAYLTGLQAPKLSAEYGYKTYNFFTDREKIISPIDDMTYFGVLANTEGAENIKVAYTEEDYKLDVSRDSSVFLWNSRALRDIQTEKRGVNKLDQYRSAASSIQIGVDTRQFGWYTDIKLDEEGKGIDLRKSTFNHWDRSQGKWVAVSLHKLANIDSNTLAAQNAAKARFSYWTVQDTYGNQLMNLSAADPDNVNDIDYYKSKDDGSVLDPLTGQWLLPSDDGYEQAALSDENYAGAFALKTSEDGTISYVIEDGFKLSPFLKATLPNGETDYIFAYDEVNARDPRHKRSSMVVFEDSGIIRFEDTIGGDYDYNDVIFDPSRDPQLAALIASRLVG